MIGFLNTTNIDFSDGNYPLGGYGINKFSKNSSGTIETNMLSFTDSAGEIFTIVSVDALYAGDLVKFINVDNCVICASHTHYSPMIDSKKPKLGKMSSKALRKWQNSILGVDLSSFEIDECDYYTTETNVHTYRRFDRPRNWLNKLLSRRLEFHPNAYQKIDKKIYIWIFKSNKKNKFAFVYHAGHPVSRRNEDEISADYVGVIRNTLRQKFDIKTVIFFQGCSGDVRPNITTKRNKFLPKLWLNKKFKLHPSVEEENLINNNYKKAINQTVLIDSFACDLSNFSVSEKKMTLKENNLISYKLLSIAGKFEFQFIPFEMSHFFQLETNKKFLGRFLVSCCNDTIGYLPHPSQLIFSGYEVDTSRALMSLDVRQELISADFME